MNILWSERPLSPGFHKCGYVFGKLLPLGGAGLKKMSQNSGHTKHRSTIWRRCVERDPHPNPLPEGIGVNFVDDIT